MFIYSNSTKEIMMIYYSKVHKGHNENSHLALTKVGHFSVKAVIKAGADRSASRQITDMH